MRSILRHLFSEHLDPTRWPRGLSTDQRKAIRSIRTCRTAAQGSHLRICPNGDHIEHHYNSCKHRCCPQCGGFESARWADRQQQKALPCSYYHIIFTLPHELIPLWLFNKRTFARHFFAAAWSSLEALYRDPQWVGGRPGAIAVFQSWGETLNTHPHLHVLITAGGLDPHGTWHHASRSYLMPTAVLSAAFKGRFLNALRKALLRTHTIDPPPNQRVEHWATQFNRLAIRKWHIQIQPPYQHPKGLLLYLAFYLRGGPISEHRIHLGHNQTIQIDYKRPTEHRTQHCTLSIKEFITRFLVHVPPRGLRVARAYGLFHPRAHVACRQAHLALAGSSTTTSKEPAPLRRVAASPRWALRCPRCGAILIVRRTARAPPFLAAA